MYIYIYIQRPLTLTIGNRGRALRTGGISVGGGRLDGTEASVTLVGHLAAVVRVLSIAVRRLLGVRRGVLAKSLDGWLFLFTRRGASTAARVLATLVVVDGRLVLWRVVSLDGATRYATLHDVSFRKLARYFKTGLLNTKQTNPVPITYPFLRIFYINSE